MDQPTHTTPQTKSQPEPFSGEWFSALKPMHIFFFGLVQGAFLVCTVGFFILLFAIVNGTASMDDLPGDTSRTQVDEAVVTAGGGGDTATAPSGPTPDSISISDVDPKTDHIRGSVNAPITIVEYSDLGCHFCGVFHPTMSQIVEKYDGDVRWVYRQAPLRSPQGAMASECAGDQGKFWEFIDLAFERQSQLSNPQVFQDIGKQIGLNMTTFNSCIEEQKFANKINSGLSDFQRSGANGTPFSVLITPDGETIPLNGAQPFGVVDQMVQALL